MNKNKFNYEYEIQIKCPSKKSYQSHIVLMDEIIGISKNHNVIQKVHDTDQKRFLITWQVQFNNPQNQANAIVECMALLSRNNVVPGEMIYQREIESSSKKIKKVEKVINLIDEELYGQTA